MPCSLHLCWCGEGYNTSGKYLSLFFIVLTQENQGSTKPGTLYVFPIQKLPLVHFFSLPPYWACLNSEFIPQLMQGWWQCSEWLAWLTTVMKIKCHCILARSRKAHGDTRLLLVHSNPRWILCYNYTVQSFSVVDKSRSCFRSVFANDYSFFRQGTEQSAGREDLQLGKEGSKWLNPGVSFWTNGTEKVNWAQQNIRLNSLVIKKTTAAI